MRFATAFLFAGLVFSPIAVLAQPNQNAAYLDFQAMGFFEESDLSVNVNLNGSLLRLLSAFAGNDDPEAAALLGKLESVQVRVLPLNDAAKAADLLSKVSELSRQMGSAGWDRIVQVRERDERVEVYLQHDESVISGLTVFAIEADREAVFVNLVGELDLKQFSELKKHFDFEIDGRTGSDSLDKIGREMDRLRELRNQRSEDKTETN